GERGGGGRRAGRQGRDRRRGPRPAAAGRRARPHVARGRRGRRAAHAVDGSDRAGRHAMSFDANRLFELLPAIHRLRDGQVQHPGALRALIDVIAEQVAVLEEDLAQAYDDQFIETCAEWVAPYIGDLIGYRSLHAVAPRIGSPRAEVANTIAYRRRKGTASMLEQLARDVSGWDARAVEFFQQLATTQYMNHLARRSIVAFDVR